MAVSPEDSRFRRRTLAALVLLTTVTSIVSSLGAPLVPAIADDYGIRLADAQWTLTATLVCGAVSTPLLARLGSGARRRPVILASLVIVLLGTILSAVAPGFGALVAGRTLQGLGMASVPVAIAVVCDVLPADRVRSAVATLSVSAVAGAGLGYPITTLMATLAGVDAAFWLAAGLLGATLVVSWLWLPDSPGVGRDHVDVAGTFLLSLGIVSLLLAVSRGAVWGWVSGPTLGLAVGGCMLLAGWARRSLRIAYPVVDLRLAVRPGLIGPNCVAIAAGAGMYSVLTLVMVVAQESAGGFGLGGSIAVAGLLIVPYSLTSVVGSQFALAVARRYGGHLLLPTGSTVLGGAAVYLAFAHDHWWQLVVAMAWGGVGGGFTFSSLAVLMTPLLPAGETGAAIAFNQLLRTVGFSVGSSAGIALFEVAGSDSQALTVALLVITAAFVAAVAAAVLDERAARAQRRQTSTPTLRIPEGRGPA